MISKNKDIAIFSVGVLIFLFCFSLFIGNYEINFIKGTKFTFGKWRYGFIRA